MTDDTVIASDSIEHLEGTTLPRLEQQIMERLEALQPLVEEHFRLQILLDAIDLREPFPVPDWLTGRVELIPQPTEEQRAQARERVAERMRQAKDKQGKRRQGKGRQARRR